MKKYLLLLLLLTTIGSYSQDQHIFEKFYVKQTEFTGNRAALLQKDLIVSKSKGHYNLQVEFGSQGVLQSKVKFDSQFNFSGQMIYNYEGKGWFQNQRMNFTIESKIKLSDLVKGVGYDENVDREIDNYEVHIFYYPINQRKSLFQKNIYFYPVQSKPKIVEQDYIVYKNFSELNKPYILQRVKEESNITGTYGYKEFGTLKIVELTTSQVLFTLELFSESSSGYLEGMADLNDNTTVFESTDFGDCKFQITYYDGKIGIKTLDDNYYCGFGNSGRISDKEQLYILEDNSIPEIK